MAVLILVYVPTGINHSLSLAPEQGHVLPKEDIGDPKQRLALHVIKAECKFVPEHVEKRTLYNPISPKVPQVQTTLAIVCK